MGYLSSSSHDTHRHPRKSIFHGQHHQEEYEVTVQENHSNVLWKPVKMMTEPQADPPAAVVTPERNKRRVAASGELFQRQPARHQQQAAFTPSIPRQETLWQPSDYLSRYSMDISTPTALTTVFPIDPSTLRKQHASKQRSPFQNKVVSLQRAYYFVLHATTQHTNVLLIPLTVNSQFKGKYQRLPRYTCQLLKDSRNWILAHRDQLQRVSTKVVSKTKLLARESWVMVDAIRSPMKDDVTMSRTSTKPFRGLTKRPSMHWHGQDARQCQRWLPIQPFVRTPPSDHPIHHHQLFLHSETGLAPGVYHVLDKDDNENMRLFVPAMPLYNSDQACSSNTVLMTRKTYDATAQTWRDTEIYPKRNAGASSTQAKPHLIVRLSRGGTIHIFPKYLASKITSSVKKELLEKQKRWRSYDIQGESLKTKTSLLGRPPLF
jgi:hypothetical protein